MSMSDGCFSGCSTPPVKKAVCKNASPYFFRKDVASASAADEILSSDRRSSLRRCRRSGSTCFRGSKIRFLIVSDEPERCVAYIGYSVERRRLRVIAKDKPRVAGATRRKGCANMMEGQEVMRHSGVDCMYYKHQR